MASLKKFNGTTWDNTKVRKLGTATDTLTTLPADIYPTGTTATVGLKGQAVQSGTPSPNNPIMPQGTGERTGNLLQIPDMAKTTKNGVTYHMKGNSLYIDGTSTTAFGFNIRDTLTLKAGTYTNQMYGFTGRRIYYSLNNVSATMCASDVNLYKTFTISEDTTYANALVWINNGATFNNEKIDFALFESEVPKEFEPYGYKIPISSANTTTPIYLGEVETTRRVKKYEFIGQETDLKMQAAITATNAIQLPTTLSDYKREPFICSHMEVTNSSGGSSTHGFYGQFLTLCFALSMGLDTLEKVRTYLQQQYAAGTPVTVWYVLATEETGIVNEPLMKIGDYADEVSGVSIPVTAGEDSVDVETTVKPSEVSLAYTGWHDAQCKEWNGSQWV